MRKTLTLAVVLLTAGSLAACKPFWEKDPPPAQTATTADPTTTTTATVDPAKPAEPTGMAQADKSAGTEKTEAPAPAAK